MKTKTKKPEPAVVLKQYLARQINFPDAIGLTLASEGPLEKLFETLAAIVHAERSRRTYAEQCAYLH